MDQYILGQLSPFVGILARTSADVIRPYFASPDLKVELKENESPVTIADKQAEEVMRNMIRQEFPDHGVIGEEFGTENPEAEYVWVLDPIDGTISFTCACPLFGTLIGLLHNGEPVLGAINLPVLMDLCVGSKEGTTINGRPVRLRSVASIQQATLLATDISNIDQHHSAEGFGALLGQVKLLRTWGDCYGYYLVAGGNADIMLDGIMNAWDILPLVPIIRGAGGVITTWEGEDPVKGTSCVAAAPNIHGEVIDILGSSTATDTQ